MQTYYSDSKQMLGRAAQFLAVHEDILNPAAQAIVPKVTTSVTQINQLGGSQFDGFNQFLSGAALRRGVARKLRQTLIDIAQTARVLDQAGTFPGLSERLHVGRKTRSYQALEDGGTAFADVVGETAIKAAYTARGFAATLADDLKALVAQFETVSETKYSGVNKRVNSTSGLRTAIRKGVAAVRDLDAILSPQLRESDTGLYAEWKRAVHIRSRPQTPGASPAAPQQAAAGVISNQSPVISPAATPVTTA